MTASDIQIQVAYNLKLSLQFVTINFTLFCDFSRWPMLQFCLNFYINLFFGSVTLAITARQLLKKNDDKA